MDLSDLKCFLNLTQTLHFGRSASALHMSASTLSRQIQRLENSLGQALFIRDNRHVELTEAGQKFINFAQTTLLEYEQIKQLVNAKNSTLAGELKLFCSVTAAYSHLPPILDKFRALHPNVEIKLSTGDAADALEKIQSREADLGIAGRPANLPLSIIFHKIGDIELSLIIPAMPCQVKQAAIQANPNWEEIPFILPEHGPSRKRVDEWFKRQNIKHPHIYATVAGHEAIVPMVAVGCGIAILPAVVVENSAETIKQRIIKKEILDIQSFDLGICTQIKRMHEPIIEAFLALIAKD
ncbi:HTH-type transcriptional activator IlvY [Thorsellia anophelis]|uniref:LysR family transcriptional regulator, positive regulator for ilvC n=1 Tax=Thorsellia anophelis DSM 18579 TaxID=1123402 RepID=A0A1H9Y3N7_9GAMM|nr:HTH-type transcriptional activator IlvY [Thorsellia anophelis]SES62947.1 LysR family transcriptional regulator, positive regulator for ilvC [Thorsellia anophelis DSM 18579]